MLTHIVNQSTAHPSILEEARRIIKPEGAIVVVEWKKIKIPFGPPLEKRVAQEEAVKVAGQVGLRLAQDFSAGNYHYGLVFKKSQYETPMGPDVKKTDSL